MAVQDRNIHRDARALRKSLVIPIADVAAGDVNADVPFFALQPRYNYRVMDLEAFAGVLGTADATLKAGVVPNRSVAGRPIFGQDAAATFTIQEFWQNDDGVLVNVTPVAAQAFSAPVSTIATGTWGVFLVQINGAQAITTKPYAASQAFPTEAFALENTPRPDVGNGVVGILTIRTTGAPFISGTTNTNAALVAEFKTYDRNGHVLTIAQGTRVFGNATLGQRLKDAAGVRILEGKGGVGGDLLVATVRSAGAAAWTRGTAVVEYRPFPAQGEGRGDMSASQTEALFVP